MSENTFSKKEIGELGENLAIDYLLVQGYQILERNWRYKKAEIDIIAKIDDCLIFVEVKTRSYTYYGQPEDSIDQKKEDMIIDAAQRYMDHIDYDWAIRFDIISIILDKLKKIEKLNHFKDAFFN